MVKKTTMSGKQSDGDDSPILSEVVELRPDLGEKKSRYYAVCTNFWGDRKNGTISLCTYAEPLGDHDSYAEAKVALDLEFNGKKKCPYCGFSHFRACEYDDLVFDNMNASLYFDLSD